MPRPAPPSCAPGAGDQDRGPRGGRRRRAVRALFGSGLLALPLSLTLLASSTGWPAARDGARLEAGHRRATAGPLQRPLRHVSAPATTPSGSPLGAEYGCRAACAPRLLSPGPALEPGLSQKRRQTRLRAGSRVLGSAAAARRPLRACRVSPSTGPAGSGRRAGRRQGAGGGAALRARRGGRAARGAAAAREPRGPGAGGGRARAEPRVRGGRAHLAAAVPAAAVAAGPPRRANPDPNPISTLPNPPLPLPPGRPGALPPPRGHAVSSSKSTG